MLEFHQGGPATNEATPSSFKLPHWFIEHSDVQWGVSKELELAKVVMSLFFLYVPPLK